MRLIKPKYEIVPQEPGLEGIYKQIEIAARNCYRSQPIEGVTPEAFVERMIKSKHLSVLEHGTVYLQLPETTKETAIQHRDFMAKYRDNPYSILYNDGIFPRKPCVTTNYRVLVENDWLDDLQYLCEPTEFHEKRVTVKLTTCIQAYKELTRHRKMSFAIESTRYCNYNSERFNNELTFITPTWVDESKLPEGTIINHDDCGDLIGEYYFHLTGKESDFFKPWKITPEMNFVSALQVSEQLYLELIKQGWKAQQAAEVLPQATKADVIMTGYVSDWEHIFRLRTSIIAETGQPHSEVSRLMDPLFEEFKTKELIKL